MTHSAHSHIWVVVGVVCGPVEADRINHCAHLNHTAWSDLCGKNPAPEELGPQFFEFTENMCICGVDEFTPHPQASVGGNCTPLHWR